MAEFGERGIKTPFSLSSVRCFMNIKNLLRDIEVMFETKELLALGLNEEEIQGYFLFYSKEWELDGDTTEEN